MIDNLTVCIVICSVFMEWGERKKGCLIFASGIVAHEFLFSGIGGATYFLSAGIVSLAVIMALALLELDWVLTALQSLSLASILANWLGWMLWVSYSPINLYNNIGIAIYTLALLVIGGPYVARWVIDSCGVLRFRKLVCAGAFSPSQVRSKEGA